MKKLLTIILAIALILPTVALADDTVYVTKHYALHIDAARANASSGKRGTTLFDYDSFTADLYLTTEDGHGYYFETKCAYGVFVNSGSIPVRIVDIGGEKLLVDGGGNNWPLKIDDESGDLWIDYGRGFFRFHLVDVFNIYRDWD